MNYIPDEVYGSHSNALAQLPRMVNAGYRCPHCNDFLHPVVFALERCEKCGMKLPLKPEVILPPDFEARLSKPEPMTLSTLVANAIVFVGAVAALVACVVGHFFFGIIAGMVIFGIASFMASVVKEVGVLRLVAIGALIYFGVTGMRGCFKENTPYHPGNVISWNGSLYRVVRAHSDRGCVVDLKTGDEISPFYWNDKMTLAQ